MDEKAYNLYFNCDFGTSRVCGTFSLYDFALFGHRIIFIFVGFGYFLSLCFIIFNLQVRAQSSFQHLVHVGRSDVDINRIDDSAGGVYMVIAKSFELQPGLRIACFFPALSAVALLSLVHYFARRNSGGYTNPYGRRQNAKAFFKNRNVAATPLIPVYCKKNYTHADSFAFSRIFIRVWFVTGKC